MNISTRHNNPTPVRHTRDRRWTRTNPEILRNQLTTPSQNSPTPASELSPEQAESRRTAYAMIAMASSCKSHDSDYIDHMTLINCERNPEGLRRIARHLASKLRPSQTPNARLSDLKESSLEEAVSIMEREHLTPEQAWKALCGVCSHAWNRYRIDLESELIDG